MQTQSSEVFNSAPIGELQSEIPLGSDPESAGGDGPRLVLRGKTVSGDFRVMRAT